MPNIDYGEEAVDIANQIEALCNGRPTASVFMELSMVLGAAAAKAERPDFDGLMKLVENGARALFNRERGS